MTRLLASSLLLLVGFLLALGGCAPQLNRIELAVQENQDELAELRAENGRLQQEMAALAKLLRMESESGDQTAAQRYAQLGRAKGWATQRLAVGGSYVNEQRDGEDYELLFTVRQGRDEELLSLVRERDREALYQVGRTLAGGAVQLLSADGFSDIAFQGYQHSGRGS